MIKKNLILVFTGAIMLLSILNATAQSGASEQSKSTSVATKKGMIKVTILYSSGEGKKFDMDYYINKHIPMLRSILGDALRLVTFDKGIGGAAPGAPAPFVVICYLYFDSVPAYRDAMKVNGTKIRGDVQNYTDIQPVIQVSEVVE